MDNLATCWWRLAKHAGAEGVCPSFDAESFTNMVARGKGGEAVPLQAEQVDSLQRCSLVDPTHFLPDEVTAVVSNPAVLIPPSSGNTLGQDAKFSAGARAEYILLMRKQCRSGKVVLSRRCAHAAKPLPSRNQELLDREKCGTEGISAVLRYRHQHLHGYVFVRIFHARVHR